MTFWSGAKGSAACQANAMRRLVICRDISGRSLSPVRAPQTVDYGGFLASQEQSYRNDAQRTSFVRNRGRRAALAQSRRPSTRNRLLPTPERLCIPSNQTTLPEHHTNDAETTTKYHYIGADVVERHLFLKHRLRAQLSTASEVSSGYLKNRPSRCERGARAPAFGRPGCRPRAFRSRRSWKKPGGRRCRSESPCT